MGCGCRKSSSDAEQDLSKYKFLTPVQLDAKKRQQEEKRKLEERKLQQEEKRKLEEAKRK